jgi:hypothetical protein
MRYGGWHFSEIFDARFLVFTLRLIYLQYSLVSVELVPVLLASLLSSHHFACTVSAVLALDMRAPSYQLWVGLWLFL